MPAVVERQYCSDDFVIAISSSVDCSLVIAESYKRFELVATELADERENISVPFTYEVGAEPQRIDFASIYTKIRRNPTQTGSTAPDLGNRSFNPPSPDLSGAPNKMKNATFTVQSPQYSSQSATDLGSGVDEYTVTVIIRAAAHLEPGWTSGNNFQS